MRNTFGILGILGLGVTVAVAQSPSSSDVKQRAATLLPAVPAGPEDIPAIARGVADDAAPYPGILPVTPRSNQGLWGNGIDPNVRPAGGIDNSSSVGSVTAPAVSTNEDPSAISRGIDKLKGAFGSTSQPNAGDGREQPNANTPFRGTTANGSVVYAGPPTWRWYGYGSVTPGANPNAPTGQYPKVSANWYSITGATPGAFPVPVTNPGRPPSGTEPPAYVAAPPARNTQIPYNSQSISTPVGTPPTPPAPSVLDLPRTNSLTDSKPPSAPPPTQNSTIVNTPPKPSLPLPTSPTAISSSPANAPIPALPQAPSSIASPSTSTPTPTIPAIPVIPQAPIAPPAPVGTPSIGLHSSLPVNPPSVVESPTTPLATEPPSKITLSIVPPVAANRSSEPTSPVVDLKPNGTDATLLPGTIPTTPGALPVSVTDNQLKWQPTTQNSVQGEWSTAGKSRPISSPPAANQPSTPAQPPSALPSAVPTPAPSWQQPGATDTTHSPTIARGQIGENLVDPLTTLIQRMCEGRADGVDVRWTGSKRISVCFECRTTSEAQQLVRDISARPELTSYRIDFCVLVK